MRLFYSLLLVALNLFCATVTMAQRRGVGEWQLLPEVQAELALDDDDYAFASFNLLHPTQNSGASTFTRGQLSLGYEHFVNEQWSWGSTLRATSYETQSGDVLNLETILTPELFVRHWNTIGNYNFRQRFGLEYNAPLETGVKGRAVTRLRLDLDRLFPLGGKTAVRPRLAYEAATYLRLQRDDAELKERFVDFGALRAEVGVVVSQHFDFTPWVASQTAYLNTLPQFDSMGQQTSGGRTNLVSPVVGLDMRYTLFRGGTPFERRQLPTQH